MGLLILALAGPSWQTTLGQTEQGPAKIEIKQIEGRYRLFRNGQPYYIQGAGLEFGSIDALAERGGNSFRTWRTENGQRTAREILDDAQRSGLTVSLCLDLGRERYGFDYGDQAAVARQLATAKAKVIKYKDHPALLMWILGNELNLNATDPRVWDAVNDLSKMIHEVDPNHLTTTALAGFRPELVRELQQRAPDLDLLAIQMYADLANLPKYLEETGWDGPYVVSEWGATGHWEVAKTPWGAPIENNSTVKADLYRQRYESVIAADQEQCVGSYVFLWGQKQERTPTWYGMFLESGESTEAVDTMQFLWTGRWPRNRAPRMGATRLHGKTAYDGIYLQANTTYPAVVNAEDPDGDPLTYRWDLKLESSDLKEGGDQETTPASLPGLVVPADQPHTTLTAPATPGAYRLFIEVFDGHGHGAHANVPFFVNE